jgi:hypothetical protein
VTGDEMPIASWRLIKAGWGIAAEAKGTNKKKEGQEINGMALGVCSCVGECTPSAVNHSNGNFQFHC